VACRECGLLYRNPAERAFEVESIYARDCPPTDLLQALHDAQRSSYRAQARRLRRRLPRGATVLDFAYTIHTDIGDQAIAARVNHEHTALRTELRNGDIVEIVTAPSSRPTPNWLTFVRTGKARSAIRHHLRTINLAESTELGKRLLAQALSALGIDAMVPDALAERLLNESSAKSLDELYADIGVGKRMATLVARHIRGLMESDPNCPLPPIDSEKLAGKLAPVVITGNEGVSVQLGACCQPIPGDGIMGQLKRDQGIVVHATDCEIAKRQYAKEPERWIDLVWSPEPARRFDCRIKVLVDNEKGVLARVAAEIGESDANIVHVGMDDDRDHLMKQFHFTIQVDDRIHLARLMRNVRRIPGVARILRERG
jgi:GTP pyrophosphokinase